MMTDPFERYSLRPLRSPHEWAAYHAIRRDAIFARLLPGQAYDGLDPGTTARILRRAQARMRAGVVFCSGAMRRHTPQPARRELTEGHNVAHHTFSHPLLNRMPLATRRG
jgi:peptidoglycan/xylan/chitin deacetylase (PgdA/CDA1 family)